jgi:hypothetical protein
MTLVSPYGDSAQRRASSETGFARGPLGGQMFNAVAVMRLKSVSQGGHVTDVATDYRDTFRDATIEPLREVVVHNHVTAAVEQRTYHMRTDIPRPAGYEPRLHSHPRSSTVATPVATSLPLI